VPDSESPLHWEKIPKVLFSKKSKSMYLRLRAYVTNSLRKPVKC
jgi:hypothetical protein